MLNKFLIIRNGPVLLSLLGSLSINIYGCFAFLGILIFFIFSTIDHKRVKLIDFESHAGIFSWLILFGVIGARIFHVICDYQYFFANPIRIIQVWDGGLSLMGGILAVIIFGFIRLNLARISFFAYADLISTYAPLFQAISRLGCFFAGCCFGAPVKQGILALRVVYTNPSSLATVGMPIHATQLYSSILSLFIFFSLLILSRLRALKTGTIFFAYLFLEGSARGIVDFFRGDREIILSISQIYPLTVSQLFAFFLAIFGLVGLLVISYLKFDRQTEDGS